MVMYIKIKSIILIIFLYFQINTVWGQQERAKFWGVEAGMNFIICNPPEKDFIRGDISSYGAGKVTDNLEGLLNTGYLGAKTELRSLNNKFGLLGGIRYTRIISSIGKNTYWSETPNFFYLLYRQDGITTEYFKVRELNQTSDYLGVPIELRFFPFNQEKFRIYFKAGAEFNFLLKTKKDVVFYNKAMESYQNEVIEIIGEPNSFYSSLYFSAGFRLGKDSKPGINFEICLPYFFLTTEVSSLVTPQDQQGYGFQLNIQIPF